MRRRVVVEGRVQGVFFRDSCRREAVAAGVSGWVRNMSDGRRVEAVLQGEEPAVARVVDWCRVGPPRAAVTGVEVVDEPVVVDGPTGFLVR